MISLRGVPFYAQQTDYTCGPAALRMALGFFGTHVGETHLVHEVHTSTDYGTHHRWLIAAPGHHRLHTRVHERASLRDIRAALRAGHPVIVHYLEPEGNDGHYAVVVGVGATHVILNDPWFGEHFRIPKRTFKRRWHDEKNRFPSWMMAVSDAPIARD